MNTINIIYYAIGFILGYILKTVIQGTFKKHHIDGVIIINDEEETIHVGLTNEKILDPKSKKAILKIEHISRN